MRTHMDIDMKNPDTRVPTKDDKMIKHITNNCSAQQLCVLSCTESGQCFQQKQNRNKIDSQQKQNRLWWQTARGFAHQIYVIHCNGTAGNQNTWSNLS